MRFFGATFDPSGLYRFNAVMRWLVQLGVDFSGVHAQVEGLQRRFVESLTQAPVRALPLERLVPPIGTPRGNFLTFALPWATEAESALAEHHVSVDRRGDRLRFGFGIYHDESFVDRLVERLRKALAALPQDGEEATP